jgi:hypothetical protein
MFMAFIALLGISSTEFTFAISMFTIAKFVGRVLVHIFYDFHVDFDKRSQSSIVVVSVGCCRPGGDMHFYLTL